MNELKEIKKELKEIKQNQSRRNRLWFLGLLIMIIFGGVFAGSHYASQILTGTFLGNYTFNSTVSFSKQPHIEQSYYYLPKNSQFVIDLANSNCVDNGANYKCAYEPDTNGDGCPDDMSRVGAVCVDKYEASYNCSIYTTQETVGSGGPINTSGTEIDTYLWQTRDIAKINGYPAVCQAKSKNNSVPYTAITQYDAKQSCLLAGKHLIKNADWQNAVVGTPDNDTKCNINGITSGGGTFIPNSTWYNQGGNDTTYSGSASNCKSKYGVYDMIGNVWEWTADLMDTKNTNSDYPNSATYGGDYIWRQNITSLYVREGINQYVAAFLRGGYWNDGANAGAFALDLADGPSRWSWSVGFRCSSAPLN